MRKTLAHFLPAAAPLLAAGALALSAWAARGGSPAGAAFLAAAMVLVAAPMVSCRPAGAAARAVVAGLLSLAAAWGLSAAVIRLAHLTGIETALSVRLADRGIDAASLRLAGMGLVSAAAILPVVCSVVPAGLAAGGSVGRRESLAAALKEARRAAPMAMLTVGLAAAGARLAGLGVLAISSVHYGPRLLLLEMVNREEAAATVFMVLLGAAAAVLSAVVSVIVAGAVPGGLRHGKAGLHPGDAGRERPAPAQPALGRRRRAPGLARLVGLTAAWVIAAYWHNGLAATPAQPAAEAWQLVQARPADGRTAAQHPGDEQGTEIDLDLLSGSASGERVRAAVGPPGPEGRRVWPGRMLVRVRMEDRRPAGAVVVGPVRSGWMLHLAFAVAVATMLALGPAAARALAVVTAGAVTVTFGAGTVIGGAPGEATMIGACVLAAVAAALFSCGVNRRGLRLGLVAAVGLLPAAGALAIALAFAGDPPLDSEPVAMLRMLTRNAGVGYGGIVLGGALLAVLGPVVAVANRGGGDAPGAETGEPKGTEAPPAAAGHLAALGGSLVAAVVLAWGGARLPNLAGGAADRWAWESGIVGAAVVASAAGMLVAGLAALRLRRSRPAGQTT